MSSGSEKKPSFLKRAVRKIDNKISRRLIHTADAYIDRRICGQSLVEYVPSIFRDDENGVGGTGSHASPYCVLECIFSHVTLTASDTLMDVGCGKGRILAFLVKEHCPCQIYGVEHNPEVARLAAQWSERYEQVHIIQGDAFQLDYNPFTVLTLARPFLPKTFLSFVEQLEATLTHPVTLIYYEDQESSYLLRKRSGWRMLFREKVARIRGVKIAPWPQGYSIWVYDPARRESDSASPETAK